MDLLWPPCFYRLFLPMCIIVIYSSTLGHSQNFSQPMPSSPLASRDLNEIDERANDEIGDTQKLNNLRVDADILSQCLAFQEAFSVESARFIKCSVHNARPLRVCVQCVGFYERAVEVYKYFDVVTSPCHDMLLKADRVQVMAVVYGVIQDLWTTAYCANCFSSINLDEKNGTVSYTLSNSTETFLQLYENTTSCFNRTNGTAPSDMPSWNSSLCFECRDAYKALNSFFDDTMTKNTRKVCMDIVDMMNQTRKEWGATYNCTHSNRQDAPILALSVCLLLSPAFLYGGARLWGVRGTRSILKEKRYRRGKRLDYGSLNSGPSPSPIPNPNPNPNPNPEPNGVDNHSTTRARDTPLQSPLE